MARVRFLKASAVTWTALGAAVRRRYFYPRSIAEGGIMLTRRQFLGGIAHITRVMSSYG